jgi:RNA polymerase sigma-70 factor (ECF subfamily)
MALAYRSLERLPAVERVVWVLRHVEGESLDDIAQICACSKSTVQRRLRLAQKTLAQRMSHV